MDYEKLYKEALERAKGILDTRCKEGEQGEFHRKDLQDIFPELKESEDDRIRRELIRLVNDKESDELWGEYELEKRKVIAWIEKQGVKEPGEWTRSDRSHIEKLITIVNAEEHPDEAKWLISVYDRVIPQPKQEWSKKDDEMLYNIRNMIFKYAYSQSAVDVNGDLCEQEYIDANVWLQSRKLPHYCDSCIKKSIAGWKPSEEQIKAIRLARSFVTDDFSDNPTLSELLVELEEQLKKLREE